MAIAWRPLLRELISYLLVAVFVGGAVIAVWWTRHPDSAALTALRSWPLVGRAAARLQDRYLPPVGSRVVGAAPGDVEAAFDGSEGPATASGSTSGSASGAATEGGFGGFAVEYVYEPRPPRPYVWVVEGTALLREPRLGAESLATLDATTNLFVEERRGDWARVRYAGRDAWVLRPQPDGQSDGRPRGDRPAPVLPLPARPADPAIVTAALEAMSGEPLEFRLGPYRGRSDFDPAAVVAACETAIASLEDVYRRELGVEPVGEAAELLLLFAVEEDYRAFAGERLRGPGHSVPGYAATHAENRDAASVCDTLVHEAAHLLNRRAIGPALPPWLGEGIAEYLESRGVGPVLPGDVEVPGLEALVELDEERFRSSDSAVLYAASGQWIAYLMQEPELRAGFRGFLAYLAGGGPWAAASEVPGPPPLVRQSAGLGDDLTFFLGRDAERLDAGFRAWLWSQG